MACSILCRQFQVRRIFFVPTLEQELILGQFTLRQLQRSNVSKVLVHLVTEEKASDHRDAHADTHGALVQLVVQPLLPQSLLQVRIHLAGESRSSTNVAESRTH